MPDSGPKNMAREKKSISGDKSHIEVMQNTENIIAEVSL
jgi:hypothetical protein